MMKNSLLKLLVLMTVVLPAKSFAIYKSEKELLSVLARAGYKNVLKIPAGNTAPDISMLTIDKNGSSQEEDISSFANKNPQSLVRVPELDYISGTSVIKSLNMPARAYKVANVFLCYREEEGVTQKVFAREPTFGDCYIFPRNIDEVVSNLKKSIWLGQ